MTAQKKPIVLVIDDEPHLNQAIHDTFEDDEFEVHSALSGKEGYEVLTQTSIDVCIVDMRLPDVTGNDFISTAHKEYAHLKFIIHTGSTNYIIPGDLQKIGIMQEQIFVKPVADIEELVRAAVAIHNAT